MKKKHPRHVGFIMDGNGRWAAERNLPRFEGHRRGAEALDKIIAHSMLRGVEAITFYAFSCENWNRPKEEVGYIMKLLEDVLENKRQKLLEKKIRFRAIGELNRLPESLQRKIEKLQLESASNKAITLSVALSYSSRREIFKAACDLKEVSGSKSREELSEEDLDKYMYTSGLPELDLIVRTSGEKRLSNFLLWQAAYAELYFTDVLWPDFDEKEYDKALEEFSLRERRFGA